MCHYFANVQSIFPLQVGWDQWGSVNKDQRIAIMDIPHLRNKFKQKHISENSCKYETLKK